MSKLRNFNFEANFKKDTMYLFSGSLDEIDTNPLIKLHIEQSISVVLPLEPSHNGRLSFSYHFKSIFEGVHNVTMSTISLEKLNLTNTSSRMRCFRTDECGVSEQTSIEQGLTVTQLSPNTFKARLMVIDQDSGIKSVRKFKFSISTMRASL